MNSCDTMLSRKTTHGGDIMTTNIIYHNFQNSHRSPSQRAITARQIQKGRRLMKLAANINAAMDAACMFLCGACITASLLILLSLGLG